MTVSSANTSATGGYLGPTSAAPPDDLQLDTLIGGFIAGVTGLACGMVRPRWQPKQPRTPGVDVNWVAVGVTATISPGRLAQVHHPEDQGFAVLRSFYDLDVLASFYGPRSDGFARLTQDSFHIPQNREAMVASGLNFISTDPIRRLPEIVATGARRRSDLPFRLTQVVERRYEIRNVRELAGQIAAQGGRDDGPSVLIDALRTDPPPGV